MKYRFRLSVPFTTIPRSLFRIAVLSCPLLSPLQMYSISSFMYNSCLHLSRLYHLSLLRACTSRSLLLPRFDLASPQATLALALPFRSSSLLLLPPPHLSLSLSLSSFSLRSFFLRPSLLSSSLFAILLFRLYPSISQSDAISIIIPLILHLPVLPLVPSLRTRLISTSFSFASFHIHFHLLVSSLHLAQSLSTLTQ